MITRWLALGCLVLGAACDVRGPEAEPAPPLPRATVVIDPPRVGVGQIGSIEIAVVTPPGYHALPVAPPSEVPGLWLLDVTSEPPERLRGRWIHRSRIRFRPREAGTVEWPPLRVEVEGPEGERRILETEPLALAVGSVLDRFPDRIAPFPLRAPPGGTGRGALLVSFALGAASAWLALLALRQRRRARERRARPAPAEQVRSDSWERALERLRHARSLCHERPRDAAGEAALALRRYLHERFGLPAECATTEELAALRPPFFLASRWPGLIALLRCFDAARFRPPRDEALRQVAEWLHESERFVSETIPPEARS